MTTKGIIFSAFDLLHPGHLHLLQEAKNQCDYLIVGLHVDPSIQRKEKTQPVQAVFDRYFQLKSTKFVDEVIPYETEGDLINILELYDVQKRFLGSEYKNKTISAIYTCERKNIEIIYIDRHHNYSSTKLRKAID